MGWGIEKMEAFSLVIYREKLFTSF